MFGIRKLKYRTIAINAQVHMLQSQDGCATGDNNKAHKQHARAAERCLQCRTHAHGYAACTGGCAVSDGVAEHWEPYRERKVIVKKP